MKELNIEQIKKIQLNILKDVARFCEQHNIRYSLCGGTLLGAIRHKGFIPWDDDIDIFMPRPDYIRFMNSYNDEKGRYKAVSIYNDSSFWNKIGNVFDMSTMIDCPSYNIDKYKNHVFIDVYPLDGVPKNYIKRKLLFSFNALIHFVYAGSVYSYMKTLRYVDRNSSMLKFKEVLRNIIKYFAITIFRPLPTSYICKIATQNASQYDYDEEVEVAAFVGGERNGEREVMPKDIFEKMKKQKFEDEEFYITEAYDIYLKNLYGNYMKLPPKEKRVPHHGYKAYVLENKDI